MIIADTNIISTFARVGALDFVRQLVKSDRLYVTPATFNELRRAVDAGCDFLAPTLATIVGMRGRVCEFQKSPLEAWEVGKLLAAISEIRTPDPAFPTRLRSEKEPLCDRHDTIDRNQTARTGATACLGGGGAS